MGEADVKAMAQRIGNTVARDGWSSDQSVVPDMQKILGKLTTLKVDVDLLKRTGIGKMVSKLKKHKDEIVSGYSSTLTNKWQSQLGIVSKDNTPASTPRRSASVPAADAQRRPTPQVSAATTNAGKWKLLRRSKGSHSRANAEQLARGFESLLAMIHVARADDPSFACV